MTSTDRRLATVALALAMLAAPAVRAQDPVGYNLYGAPGLIDMPVGTPGADADFAQTLSYFDGGDKITLSFQMLPRVSGSFRYTGVRDLNFSGFQDYYDRSFDLRVLALKEGRWLPAVTIGLQDFAGTGLFAGEYIAATKTVLPSLSLTLGLGWGRLGADGSDRLPGAPVCPPPAGTGGQPNADSWFRGSPAPFGGLSWQATERLRFKAEYSSDTYECESKSRGVFDRASPVNFGLEWRATPRLTLGAYSMYGNSIALSANVILNPRKALVPLASPGPRAIPPRPDRATNPVAWGTEWHALPASAPILQENLRGLLQAEGLILESLAVGPQVAELRFRDRKFDIRANALGRAARAMAIGLPASVETFRLVPVVDGMAAAVVTVRRSDLERLENDPRGAEELWARTQVTDAGTLPRLAPVPGRYPDFRWSFAPYFRTSYFDPSEPIRAETGLRLRGEVELRPGLVLAGSSRLALAGNMDDARPSEPVLPTSPPSVRTSWPLYERTDGPKIEYLTATQFFRPGRNLYGRLSVGLLETMFAGVSGEVLWRPVDSRLALGIELSRVRQRDYDMRFGLLPYEVTTGHVSAYYDLGGGFLAQVDAGRYLGGDVGATFALDRTFANGWSVGAFFSQTDVTAAEFGEGSFDKGIRFSIPVTWLNGQPSPSRLGTTIRPVQRDGAARLAVRDRLYDRLREDDQGSYAISWGRFWR